MTAYLVTTRGAGKTAEVLAWLAAGKPVDYYPHWSRVLVCVREQEALHLAELALPQARKCVVTARELPGMLRGAGPIEIAVDNADLLLAQVLGTSQAPALLTFTGQHYTPQLGKAKA